MSEPAELEAGQPDTDGDQVAPATIEAELKDIAILNGWKEGGKLDYLAFMKSRPDYRAGLVNKISKLERDNEQVYQMLTQQAMRDQAVAKETAEARIRQAADQGDGAAALRAAQALAQVRPPPPNRAEAGWSEWTNAHRQIVNDPDMWADAVAFANVEVAKLGRDDPAIIGPIVEEKLRTLYPSRFPDADPDQPPTPNHNRTQQTSAVGGGGKRTMSRKGPTLADLPPEQQMVYKQLMESNPKLTAARIMASLASYEESRRG